MYVSTTPLLHLCPFTLRFRKVAVLDFSNYQMCGMHWIAVWVQASDLPVKVAESVSCMLLHGGNYYITGSWG